MASSLQHRPPADLLHHLDALHVRGVARPVQLHRIIEAGEECDVHADFAVVQTGSDRHSMGRLDGR